MDRMPLIIGGEEVRETSAGVEDVVDPSTGSAIAQVVLAGPDEVERAVEVARANFEGGNWHLLKPFERGRIMHRIAEGLLRHRDDLADLEARESGKPLRNAYWEIDCSARFFEYYGGYCDKMLGTTVPLGPGYMDWTVHEPIGVSLHITPWNFPLQVGVRGIAPALAAGCSVIVKPATETPLTTLRLAQIAKDAGLPDGTLSVLPGAGSIVGDGLARHEGVDQITFTGSVATGKRVMEAAASHAIPTTMELGGKSPQLVLGDADLDRILPIVHEGMYMHAGQVCNAGTRLVIQESIAEQAVERLHAGIRKMSLGRAVEDPDMGPVVSAGQKSTVEEYLEIGNSEGRLLLGAELPQDPALNGGYFVRPAIVADIGNDARVAREEIFGPVLAVISASDDEDAIRIANDSQFGLVAGVHTSNIDRAMAAAEKLRAGQVWINCFSVGLDVEFPFGGYKQSGFGREKGLEAVKAYTQVKNTLVAF